MEVKNEIERINKLVKDFELQIKNETVCNIFNNFIEENKEKALVWSMKLFLEAYHYEESFFDEKEFINFHLYKKKYLEEVKSYIFDKKRRNKKTPQEAMIQSFLLGENLYLDCYCIDRWDDLGSDIIVSFAAIRYNKLNKLKNMYAKNVSSIFGNQYEIKKYLVSLSEDILEYYEEVFNLKEALEDSKIIANFSDDLFYLLMQYFIGIYRLKVIDSISYEYKELINKSLKEDIKTLFNLKRPQQEIEELMQLLYGKYYIAGHTMYRHEMDSGSDPFDSVWSMQEDYGLSFKDIKTIYYDDKQRINIFAPSTKEAVVQYAKTLKNQDYINRLANNIKAKEKITISTIDLMSGQEFEKFVSKIFQKMGYETKITKASGDQGVDVIAKNSEIKIAIQAKCYSSSVGNHAIMEAVAGMKYYKADKCMVVTNQAFTKSAIDLAKSNNVILWDRKILKEKMEQYF